MNTINVSDLPNFQIVTIAIMNLGGIFEHLHHEDIAIKANEIASGRFSWRKYPDRIDLEAVGFALRDAKKEKNNCLVIGSNTRGWMLSPNGYKWIIHLSQFDKSGDIFSDNEKNRIISILNDEKEKLIQSNAFYLYSQNLQDQITQQDYNQFIRINDYFKSKAIERRINIVRISILDNKDLTNLWCFLSERFQGRVLK